MADININTPDGVKLVRVAGDTPTSEEITKLQALFPSNPDFNWSVVEPEEEVEAQEVEARPEEITEEITSNALRYQYGRMETDEEKAELLRRKFGEGTFERVAEDTFVVDQAKVDPRTRAKYGLKDTGRIFVDKPGFSWYDVTDFMGESGTPLAAMMGAGLAVSSLAALPAMAWVGAAAGVAKLADEAIDMGMGLQKESAGQVGASAAMEAAFGFLGEGAGRLVAKGIGRLIKGPGAKVSSERVEELVAKGMSERQASLVAREEAGTRFSEIVEAGARPTIIEATGKSLSARLLAVNEAIFPNAKVGRQNTAFVRKTLKDLGDGRVSKKEAQEIFNNEAKAIAVRLEQELADPKTAAKIADRHMRGVIEEQASILQQTFNPEAGVPSEFAEAVTLAARLFRADGSALYDLAEKTMQGTAATSPKIFSGDIIKTELAALRRNPYVEYKGNIFDLIDQTPAYSISDFTNLKAALRLAIKDPDVIPSSAQGGIKRIIQKVDDTLDAKFNELSEAVARGYRTEVRKIEPLPGGLRPAGARFEQLAPTEQVVKIPINELEAANIREGLALWKEANQFWAKGQSVFNNTNVNLLVKAADGKVAVGTQDILTDVIKAGNAPRLQMFLDAVTPTKTGLTKLSQPGVSQTIQGITGLIERASGSTDRLVKQELYDQAELIIRESGLEGVLPKLNTWMAKLDAGDPFLRVMEKNYIESLESLSVRARAGAKPEFLREAVKENLAKAWINDAHRGSLGSLGKFSPSMFGNKFKNLGKDVQDVLFGKKDAQLMRETIDDFYLLGRTPDDLIDELANVRDVRLSDQIKQLKRVIDTAKDQSRSQLMSSIKEGAIRDPKQLVTAVLSNPDDYARLVNAVGDDAVNKVGGVKDMVMDNLVRQSFKSNLDEASIQSGSWGKEFAETVLKQDQNGALTRIFGADSVMAMKQLGKEAVDISNVPIKGWGGIAAAPAALGLMALVFTNPLLAAGTATGVLLSSRLLRNKTVLKLLTSPRLRKKEYEAAIKAGANLPGIAKLKQNGPYVYAANRIASIVADEAALVTASGLFGVPGQEVGKAIPQAREALTQETPSSARVPTYSPSQPLPGTMTREELLDLYRSSPSQQYPTSPLRATEEAKLRGESPYN